MAQLVMKRPRPSLAHLDWYGLLLLAAVANLGLLLALAASLRDLLALVLALMLGLSLGLLAMGWRRLGVGVLGLVNTYIAVYTLSSAVINIVDGHAVGAVATSSALGAIALAGLTGAGAIMLGQGQSRRSQGIALPVLARVLGLFCLLVLASVVTPAQPRQPVAAERILAAENMAFATKAMTVEGGTLTLALANHDLVWHTFTIDALDVNLIVPAGGQRAGTFAVPPGTYLFYCGVPGHRLAGMEGVLTVIGQE